MEIKDNYYYTRHEIESEIKFCKNNIDTKQKVISQYKKDIKFYKIMLEDWEEKLEEIKDLKE